MEMSMTEYKQIIVLRSDIKMTIGKAAAQASHAAISAAEKCRKEYPVWWKNWMCGGQRKIILQAKSENDLLMLKRKIDQTRIPSALIVDQGLTELKPGTKTSLGIGPAPSRMIDKLTASIPLFRS